MEQFEVQVTQVPTLTGRRRRRRRPRDARIGRWVEVYWAGDAAWYLGRVASQRNGRFKIAYADGETVSQALMDEAFEGETPPPQPDGAPEPWRFAEAPTEAPAAAPPPRRRCSRPAALDGVRGGAAGCGQDDGVALRRRRARRGRRRAAARARGRGRSRQRLPLRYRDAGAWRGQEVTLDSGRLVAFEGRAAAPAAAPPPPRPAAPSAPPTGGRRGAASRARRAAAPGRQRSRWRPPSRRTSSAAPTSYGSAATIEAQARRPRTSLRPCWTTTTPSTTTTRSDAFDVTEGPFELGGGAHGGRERPNETVSRSAPGCSWTTTRRCRRRINGPART